MTATAPTFVCGLDLGQVRDPTGLVAVERTGTAAPFAYDVREIQRLPLQSRYPEIVAHACAVVAALRQPAPLPPPATDRERVNRHHDRLRVAKGQPPQFAPKPPSVALVIDHTGVGRPIYDQFLAAKPDCALVGVTITAGESVARGDAGEWRVPKRILASTIQVLLQSGRLRIAEGLPLARELTNELTGFKVKISLSGHDSYAAGEDWRSAPHDDLVLALALACWWGERAKPARAVAAGGVPQVSPWGPPPSWPPRSGPDR